MKFVRYLLVLLVVVGAGAFVYSNYSWVFSKRVKGKIVSVERVTDPSAIISSRVTPEQLHSYSILIQGEDNKLYAASSEDRKWQVVKTGYCVDALLYRYPFWELNRANTFFNARLDEVSLCQGETVPGGTATPAEMPATAPVKEPATGSAPEPSAPVAAPVPVAEPEPVPEPAPAPAPPAPAPAPKKHAKPAAPKKSAK